MNDTDLKLALDETRDTPARSQPASVVGNREPPQANSERPDDEQQGDPLYGKRIDVTRSDELQRWATYFNVTPEEIRMAVSIVGTWARVVRSYLN
ncbi:MAG TPA: DUF3606 domain-containing protein [Tahibacter sp.]|nr:DUF3606 domain-containing protein [Tahibacter sp.]